MIRELPLAGLRNRHAGETAVVVGRGPTNFDYRKLSEFAGPVFFLNDAVQLDRHAVGAAYLVAVDNEMVRLLYRPLKAVPVLPRSLAGSLASVPVDLSVVYYECDRTPRERLLLQSREQLAALGELYNGSVTIMTALHLVWYCGCVGVVFIGCDGLNEPNGLRRLGAATNGYDSRLANLSHTAPGWKYQQIREAQDQICRQLNLAVRYVGTPAVPHPNPFHQPTPVIPALAHYIWLGGAIPEFMRSNIERFKLLHPEWEVRVWQGLPESLPAELRDFTLRLHQLCMRSDVLRIWLLHEFGGFYLDGDVFPVRPFDELRHYGHFFTLEKQGTSGTNCVMGATPGDGFTEKLMNRVAASRSRPTPPTARTAFGPRLYTALMHGYPGLVNPLPEHYFCLFQDHAVAFPLVQQPFPEIHRALVEREAEFTDGVWPFGIHTYGIPTEQLDSAAIASSWAAAIGRADALLRRVGASRVTGVEVGVADEKMSAYLLGHHPSLRLHLVDRWPPSPTGSGYRQSVDAKADWPADPHELARLNALKATRFANDRFRLLQMKSYEAARCVAPGSLDFVLIGAEYSYEAVRADIAAWVPALKPGGWLGGHDYHGSAGVLWGVRQAVDEFAGRHGLAVELDEDDTWFIRLP